MSSIPENKLRSRSGWPEGIDNQHEPQSLALNDHGNAQAALLKAENVDLLTGAGKPRRRKGYTLLHAGTRMHSLWKAEGMAFALFVENGTLRAALRRARLALGQIEHLIWSEPCAHDCPDLFLRIHSIASCVRFLTPSLRNALPV